jgi:hypothetical protein
MLAIFIVLGLIAVRNFHPERAVLVAARSRERSEGT